MKTLDSVLIDCLFDDATANKFLKEYYLGKPFNEWTWNDFSTNLFKYLAVTPKPEVIQGLKKMLVVESEHKDHEIVVIEKFSQVVDWFFPLQKQFFDRMEQVFRQDWFHGDIKKEEAESTLATHDQVIYLVRTTSTTKNCPFTISKRNKKGEISHVRIQRLPDLTFAVEIKVKGKPTTNKVSKDGFLSAFIAELKKDLHLVTPCPGSKYKALFVTNTKVVGYKVVED